MFTAIRQVLERMREAMTGLRALGGGDEAGAYVVVWRQALNGLMDIEKHYQRKENVLFARLEAHGITGPSKVMWAKEDEIRRLLKELEAALREREATLGEWQLLAATLGEQVAGAVEEMIHKEENILLPLALNVLTEEDWAEIWLASPRYGWCLVEPEDGYRPPERMVREGLKLGAGERVELPTGTLSIAQLEGLLQTLPVDITFVDADDRVAFFSEGRERIFARSRAILGRKVQHCHPPKSVETVERILSDFRAGRQQVAEFWIDFRGRFVHIRYFAVRDKGGEYLGTLEVTQDLTRLRTLTGERRLLEYDAAPAGGGN